MCNHGNSIHKEHQPQAAVADAHTHSHASSAADANRGVWTAVLKWNLLDYHREVTAAEWRLWHQSHNTLTLIEISYEQQILAFDMLATGVILWLFEYGRLGKACMTAKRWCAPAQHILIICLSSCNIFIVLYLFFMLLSIALQVMFYYWK